MDLFKQYLINSNVSIIGLSESWLNSSIDTSMIQIPDYECVRLDRAWFENTATTTKRGGGVCCFIKNGVTYSSTELKHLNNSSRDGEFLWLTINQVNIKKLIVCNLYRPPQGNIANFCDMLDTQIELLLNNHMNTPEIYIMVDFNVNIKDTQDGKTKALKWLEQKFGLTQHIKDFTRFALNNSCIDLVYSNCKKVFNSGTLDLNLSDHQAIFISRKHIPKIKTQTEFTGRSYLNFDEANFVQRLNNLDWNEFYEIDEADMAWDHFVNKITEIIYLLCPVRKINIELRI